MADNLTAEQQLQQVQAFVQQEQQKAAAANLARQKQTSTIIELGQSIYGTMNFDEASQTVASALGQERVPEFMAVVGEFDDPAAIVVHLANNETRLQQLAKLPLHRMITEVARIESQMKPHGHVATGADPSWKTMAKTGISEIDWAKTGGDQIHDDAAWNRAFDLQEKRRAERRGRR